MSIYLYICISSSGLVWQIEICREYFLLSHRNSLQFVKKQNTLFERHSHASSLNFYFPFPFFEDFKICSFNSFIIISNFSLASRSCLSSSWSSCLSASAWSNLCLNSASCKREDRHLILANVFVNINHSRTHWWPPYESDRNIFHDYLSAHFLQLSRIMLHLLHQ